MEISENISPELIAVYRDTQFHVTNSGKSFTLRIDKFSTELDELLKKHNKHSSAYITACNPQSIQLTEEQISKRHMELKKDLESYNCVIYEGFGEDPRGEWVSEKSYLALGISEKDACKLEMKYRQNAIVCSKRDAIPRLVLLR